MNKKEKESIIAKINSGVYDSDFLVSAVKTKRMAKIMTNYAKRNYIFGVKDTLERLKIELTDVLLIDKEYNPDAFESDVVIKPQWLINRLKKRLLVAK